MKLTARLALSQIKTQKNRSISTILGIAFSSAMLTAVVGLGQSSLKMMEDALGPNSYSGARLVAVLIVGFIFSVIIIAASVIVVSNSFRVSAGERTRQFGILKSVGATKKQIASSVLYEGVFLSVCGLPLGFTLGLIAEYIGVSVANASFHKLYESGVFAVDSRLPYAVSPLMFLISVSIAFGTVMLSAWLPAKKASRIPAIDAIRSAGEVIIKRRSVKTSRLTQRVFGFEGALAAKSMKRSKRSYRATVVSLTLSIVLLLCAGAFGSMMNALTGLMYEGTGATAAVFVSRFTDEAADDGGVKTRPALAYELAETISQKMREYPDTGVFGGGKVGQGHIAFSQSMATKEYIEFQKRALGKDYDESDFPARLPVNIAVLDSTSYARLCETAKVPLGSTIFINKQRVRLASGYVAELSPLNAFIDRMEVSSTGDEKLSFGIDAYLGGDSVPKELRYVAGDCAIIMPDGTASSWMWLASAKDNAGFTEYCDNVIPRYARTDDGLRGSYSTSDIAAQSAESKTIFGTIMFFVYAFIAMLALIALTSVVSTVSTNVRSRSREFAVLQSAGMTRGGIRKMLNLESALSSVRSILFGIPIGLLGAYGVYRGLGLTGEIGFIVPWPAVAGSVAAVFIINWATMIFAASRLKDGSIVEVIRGE
jgi:putative ABC transport system permease protein